VLVDISNSHGCKNPTCKNEKIVYFSRVKTEQRKEKTPSDELAVPWNTVQRLE
jgi:hypothetical protein